MDEKDMGIDLFFKRVIFLGGPMRGSSNLVI